MAANDLDLTTIGGRLESARGKESREIFGPKAGVSKNTVVNYEKGFSATPVSYLTKVLALRPHINPTWLLTGEGPQERHLANVPAGTEVSIDPELFAAVIAAVEEHLALVRKRLHPDKKAQLIITLYDLFSDKEEKTVDPAAVISLIKLAA